MTSSPEQFLAGPLRWTAKGSVMATWWLKNPLPIARNEAEAANNIEIERGLWEALAGHKYWLESMICWTNPQQIVDAMLAEHRDEIPGFASTVEDALEFLDEKWLGTRRFLLTVELSTGLHDGITRAGKAAASSILALGGLAPLAPSAAEYERALDTMTDLGRRIPAEYGIEPATPALMEWARRHHIRRTGEDLTSLFTDADRELMATPESSARLESAALDPSGISTLPKWQRARAPWTHKYVAVTDEDGNTNYQAHLVARTIPRQLSWPSFEFLRTINSTGVPVDYSIVGLGRTKNDAQLLNAEAMNKLNNQVDQVTGASLGKSNNHLSRLRAAANVLSDYTEDFTADENLVEHEHVIIASIVADTPEDVESQVKKFLAGDGPVTWTRPIGVEDAAFLARQPGGDLIPELFAFRQITHSATMASMASVTGSRLGHDSGFPLWEDQALEIRRAVFWEPFGEGDQFKQRAAAMATQGEQGSGKTYFAMTLAGLMKDSGARLVATDTTSEREWSIFADSLGDTRQVAKVDFGHPVTSVDPLRCLPLKEASEVTLPFLSTLLDLHSGSPALVAAREATSVKFLAEHHIDSIPSLLANLNKVTRAGADELHDLLDVWCDQDKYPALFDLDLPPVDTSRQCLIWGTHGVEMPTPEEITSEHLFKRMSDNKRMGRAIYSLFSWFSTNLCFRDPNEAALQNIDEFHHILASPEATQAQMKFLRLMRHVKAMTHYQTQLAEFPSDMLGLIGTRLVLRVDPSTLDGAVTFLLGEQKNPELRAALKAKILKHNAPGRGAGVLRMHRGEEAQIGEVQTFPPFTEARRIAASTSSSRETKAMA